MSKNGKISFMVIFLSGLLVGSLDILAAFGDYYIATGKGPEGVLKYIASGVFGMKAIKGGAGMIFLGLLFHFMIALCFSAFYFWLYQRVNLVSANPVIFAILYAVFMWTVTTRIVMPLSSVPQRSGGGAFGWKEIKAILILLFMICIPLTLIARKHRSTTSTG